MLTYNFKKKFQKSFSKNFQNFWLNFHGPVPPPPNSCKKIHEKYMKLCILHENFLLNLIYIFNKVAIPCTLPVNSIKWIFPIPQSEINGNPNITQAPGY